MVNASLLLVAALETLAALPGSSSYELEELGRDHLYNMELSAAQEVFEELSRRDPRSPAGPYYQATTLWMKEFSRRGGMTGSTFRSGRYWSGKHQPPIDEELDREFTRLVTESIELAEAALEKDPDDEEALFFRGSAEGLSSAYLASVHRSYYGAYQAGKRAMEYHERLMAVAPESADACFLPGIFEYTLATLPRTLRIVGFFIGMRGSKEKGIELVERAVSAGERTRWVARLSLSVLHQREKRYRESLSVLRELERAFPRNPFLPLERGTVHLLRKDWRSARKAFLEVRAKRSQGWEGFELVPPSLVSLRIAESHLFAKRYDEAAQELDAALASPGVPDGVRAQIFLRRGMSSDGLGRRAAAEWDYRRALKLDTDETTNALADRYLSEPFR